MLTRREFAGSLAFGLAAPPPALPRVTLITGPRMPADSCVFTRAWAACPDRTLEMKALLSGMFPHARSAPPRIEAVSAPMPAMVFISEPGENCAIALAIRHPRLPRGRTFDFPVSAVDVAPTMLGLMGLEVPDNLHGRDLSGLLVSGKGERPESIFGEGNLKEPGEWRMVVRGLDKIVVRPNLDVLHLYNLGDDPGEEHDLAQEIGNRLKLDELRALVRIWMKRTGDGMDPSGLKRR